MAQGFEDIIPVGNVQSMDDMKKSYNIRRGEDGQLETLDTMG